jgi:hypothetical protein
MDDAQLEQLLTLERRLLRAGPSLSRRDAEAMLAGDFVEFGASGRVWTRETILEELRQTTERSYEVTDVSCRSLCKDAVLLT